MTAQETLEAALLAWSLDLAESELASGLARLRTIHAISTQSLVRAIDPLGATGGVALKSLVRAAHVNALMRNGDELTRSELELLSQLRAKRTERVVVSIAPALDAGKFGKAAKSRLALQGRMVIGSGDRRLLSLQRPVGALTVRTFVGIQSRPFYFQSVLDKQGREVVSRHSFLRTLGISSQTLIDQATKGDEDREADLIANLVLEFEEWLRETPTD